jgi:flagellar motor switch protein FliM
MSEGGFEPLLSNDETDALLQAMKNGSPVGSSAKEIELGSADQRLRKSLGRADDVAREWAAEVRKIFRRMLGISVSVREQSTDIVPYSVSQQSVAPGACVCVLKAADGSPCFLVLGPGLTSFVINRRLGGSAEVQAAPTQGDDVRAFLSPLDRRIVRPFCEEVLQAMCAIWGAEQVQLSIVEVLGRPVDMPRLGQFQPLLRLPLTVSFGNDTPNNEEVTVLFSGNSIYLPHQEEAETEVPQIASGDRALMVARLSHAELELVAVLGHSNSTVRTVLSLSIGDVLRLEEAPSSPLTVFIEGQKKMIGVPVVSHGNIAIEVTQMLKGEP